jgi:hypothetical protein
MEVHMAPLPNLGGLMIGQDPLPSFQRQETPRSGDNPRLNGKNRQLGPGLETSFL